MSRARVRPSLLQICADRGIAPGATKGAALHLRGIAMGLQELGIDVTLYAKRSAEGDFPVDVRPLTELDAAAVRSAGVVYERYSLGHRTGLDLARDAGCPFVLEVNAPLVDEADRHRPGTVGALDRFVEQELLWAADLVVTVSNPLTAWVQQRRTGRTVTVTNGFEPSWFGDTELTSAARTLTPTHDLVFLGHPKPWHGADRLVDLLVDLRVIGRLPRLLIVGGGPGADELLERAGAAGVADQITITGPLRPAEASAMLRHARIGLAPYPPHRRFYFCPLKVVDYLAAGLPIVATAQGDVSELVRDAGVVVSPSDRLGLAVAVARLLDDPSTCRRMGRAGRTRAHRSLTWNHAAARTAAAIAGLAGTPIGVGA